MKLSIHFRLRLEKDTKKNPNNKITIRCHINIDGEKEIRFSTGRSIELHRWSQEAERVINDGSWEAKNINTSLNDTYDKLFKIFDYLQADKSYVNSQMLIAEYNRSLMPPKKTLEYYQEYLADLKTKIGISKKKGGIEQITYNKWATAKKHFKNFVENKLKKADIYLNQITTQMGDEFLAYMEDQNNKNGEPITELHAYRVFRNLSIILESAIKDDYIVSNPLNLSKAERPDSSDNFIHFINEANLFKLYDCEIMSPLERKVVDCFIFLSFTSFTYSDYMEFRKDPNKYIIKENGSYYIKKRRYKDRFKENPVIPIIPLMAIHKEILDRYSYNLPSFHINTLNVNIKIIAQRLEIPDAEKITSYVGRKSAGTWFVNNDGIDAKTASRIMGHRNPSTLWRYYAVVKDDTVQRQTAHLAIKTKD